MSEEPRTCPLCGGYNPGLSRDEIPEGARYCTPLFCSAWTYTARLTKQGTKPLRPDGRAALAAVPEETL